MEYQVWKKDEFGDSYTRVDCEDLVAAKQEIDRAVRAGLEPVLTVEVPYSLAIKVEAVGAEKPRYKLDKKGAETEVKEEPKSEATPNKAG